GGEDALRPLLLEESGAVDAVARLGAHRLLDRLEGERRSRGEALHHRRGLALEGLVGYHEADEAELARLLGIDVAPEHQEIEGAVAADVVHEAHHADAPG